MQPLIHGIFSLETPSENKVVFEDAVRILHEHYDDVLNKSPAYPPIADGAPVVTDEAGGLEFKTSDEFWLYKVDLGFWNDFARMFPTIAISVYYGSVVIGEDCGMFKSEGGKVSDVRYENGSPEAIEFSRGLNGMDGLDEVES